MTPEPNVLKRPYCKKCFSYKCDCWIESELKRLNQLVSDTKYETARKCAEIAFKEKQNPGVCILKHFEIEDLDV